MLLSKVSAAISKMVSPLTTSNSRDTSGEEGGDQKNRNQQQSSEKGSPHSQAKGEAVAAPAGGARPGLKVDHAPPDDADSGEGSGSGDGSSSKPNASPGNPGTGSLASTFLQIIGNVHSSKNPALRKIGANGYSATMRKRKRRSLKGMVVDESIE